MEARAARQGRRACGFTLIELAVVMLLLAIIIAVVGLSLGDNPSRDVRQEADRLAALLGAAQQQAILGGQVYALRFTADGFRFLALDSRGQLAPVEHDPLFRPRRWPPGVRIAAVTVDGTAADRRSGIVISPDGDFPPFIVVLSKAHARWQVRGTAGGSIESAPATQSHG